jgi:two-component system, NtrC family, response regulator AtoC
MVAAGTFREDLYFRLNVVSIGLPPLRERREDIPLLADYFLKKYSVQYKKPYAAISQDTLRVFLDYQWPGNIRELENVIKRIVILATEGPVQKELARQMAARRVPDPLFKPAAAAPASAVAPSGVVAGVETDASAAAAVVAGDVDGPNGTSGPDLQRTSLKEIARSAARYAERDLISRTLQHTRWNRKEAAEILGISYKALLYKIKENGLDKTPLVP